MGHIPPATPDSSNVINYPIDRMREVANDILSAVYKARQQHSTHWSNIQHYINGDCVASYRPLGITPLFVFGGDVSSHMKDVLEPHAQRLTDSYDWLEQFAHELLKAVQVIEQTEHSIAQSFQLD
ncbi:MAG: hypothetical protein JO215_12635 [Ktedonobacteraceae bacterium]|nr:hypothetical protein [Ktedonobacteraceae bacterium]